MPTRHTILIVEPDAQIAQMERQALEEAGFTVEFARTGEAALRRIDEVQIDLLLLADELPDVTGSELVACLQTRTNATQVVVVLQPGDELLAVEILKSGVADYVVKDPYGRFLGSLVRAAHNCLRFQALMAENRRLLGRLREDQSSLRTLFDAVGDPCYLFKLGSNDQLALVQTNQAGRNLLDSQAQDVLGRTPEQCFTADPTVISNIRRTLDGRKPYREERRVQLFSGGQERWLALTYTPFSSDGVLVVVVDQTEGRQREQDLKSWRERSQRLTGLLADYIFTVRVRGGKPCETVHHPACLAVTGYSCEEFTADPYLWIDMVLPEDRPLVHEQVSRILSGQELAPIEHRICRKDGVIRWVRSHAVPLRDEHGELVSYDGLIQDITERKEAEERLRQNEELFRTVAEFSSDFIFWHSQTGGLVYVSPACEAVTGYTPADFYRKPSLFDELIHPEDQACWKDHLHVQYTMDEPRSLEFRIVNRDDQVRWISHTCRLVRDERGNVLGIRGSHRDVTDRKLAEEKLRTYAKDLHQANMILEAQKGQLQAQQEELLQINEEMERLARQLSDANTELNIRVRTDPLTQLLNRRAWEEAAQREYERSVRHGSPYSILMIDVDHFKLFNDTQGHQAGDECLRMIGQCVVSVCRSIDYIGRYGGEEYVILAPETPLDQAKHLADRVRQAIYDMNVDHPANPVAPRVTASVGVASAIGTPWERVVKRADDALYVAKANGRNQISDGPAETPVAGIEQADVADPPEPF